jgi:hypothetical protein
MAEGMRTFHMKDRGFSEVAQHITTCPDGKLSMRIGRNFDKTPAGISGANANGVCIENVGDIDGRRYKSK